MDIFGVTLVASADALGEFKVLISNYQCVVAVYLLVAEFSNGGVL
jgi:hypothetical protein